MIINARDTVDSKTGKVPILTGFTFWRGEAYNIHTKKYMNKTVLEVSVM